MVEIIKSTEILQPVYDKSSNRFHLYKFKSVNKYTNDGNLLRKIVASCEVPSNQPPVDPSNVKNDTILVTAGRSFGYPFSNHFVS